MNGYEEKFFITTGGLSMLKGIRVIDLSQNLPGPFATLRLADMGAEVIKVEPPTGDGARTPLEKDKKESFLFRSMNRNKKSIVLNLKDEDDRKTAIQLIRDADVLIESFRPGVMSRLGLGYEFVSSLNKGIVYCSLSGYGQKGLMHHLGSHDINYMALSGVLAQMKDGDGRPIQPSMTFADLVGGITASEAIVAALFKRERTGEGAFIDLALQDAVTTLMNYHVLIESGTGRKDGLPVLNGNVICYNIYETKDGRYMTLGALEPKFWRNFCFGVDKEEWIPVQFSPSDETHDMHVAMKELFLSRTFDEWKSFSLAVDCCMTPVLETNELHDHPYVQERQLVFTEDGLRYMATRFTEDGGGVRDFQSFPSLGEHTKDYK